MSRSIALPEKLDILKALMTPPPVPDFVLPGLPVGTVGALVAPGATGKTLFLLQTCVALAAGMPVIGGYFESDRAEPKTVDPAKVVMVVAEESMDVMHSRLHAVVMQLIESAKPKLSQQQQSSMPSLLAANLHLYPLAGRGRLLLDGRDTTGDGLAKLGQMATGARLVIVDPVRQFHTGDENDSWAVTSLLQDIQCIATNARCAVLLAHHTNKAATFNGQGERAGASRGSAAFTDGVRWQMNLSALDDSLALEYGVDPRERIHHVRLDLAKSNYLAPQAPCVLRRRSGGVFELLHRPQQEPRRPSAKQRTLI